MNTTVNFNKSHLPFGNSGAIRDSEVISFIDSIKINLNETSIINHLEFLKNYRTWILSSQNNKFYGLDQYQYSCFTNGTTESFDKFYGKNFTRRLRFFKGEYTYHRLSCRNYKMNWNYIEDDDIRPNDAVIISLPFSNTGNKHFNTDDVLKECVKLNVPVLIDCIYVGICNNLEFNFDVPCITDITFGLSKTFPVYHHRIGMRLTRIDDDDPLFVVNKIGYVNQYSAILGNHLIKNFSSDYIYEKYKSKQKTFCDFLDLEKSDSVTFGLDFKNKWIDYTRDCYINRLSFHKFLHLENFIEDYKKNEER